MKKTLCFALIAALILAMLAGCSAPVAQTAPAATEAPAKTEEAAPQAEAPAEAEAAEEPWEPVTLKVGFMGKGIKPVGVIVAMAKGFFEEEGIVIDAQKVSSMNDAYLAVSKGDLDVYLFSSTAAATFISQGTTTLRVFGGTAGEGSEIMCDVNSDLKLDTLDDFVGKTVACMMPETGQMVLKSALLDAGYTIGGPDDNADVTFIYFSDTNAAIEGCKKGEFDCCITNSVMGYYADEMGVRVVAAVKDFVPTYPCCRQTCYQGTYENNFEALVRFEIATIRGHEYYKNTDNMEEVLDILQEFTDGQDREYLKAQVYGTENYTPVMRLTLDPDKKACVAFYEAMANIGEIEDVVDVDWNDYVVTDVYETALKTLLEREPGNALYAEMYEYFLANN